MALPKINTIVLSGRMTADPILKYTKTSKAVANFTLAFDRSYKGADGQWINEASFMPIVVWGKTAEIVAEKGRKGSPIIIDSAYLQTRSYVDKDNNNRKVAEIVANRVHFLEKTGGMDTSTNDAPPQPEPETDDSVPF